MSQKKVVLITGANSGIGFATAKVITAVSDQYHVIVASRSAAKGKAAIELLRAEDSKLQSSLSTLQLEVTDQKSVDAAVEEVMKAHGRLDVLVNNAGVSTQNPDFITQLKTDLEINVVGAAMVAESFKPLLAKAASPYIIYVGSRVGSTSQFELMGAPEWKAYSASKAALLMMALAEHKHAKSQGSKIKVFAMCPGFVVSNIRGTAEEQRNPGGQAGDPDDAGRTILQIIEGGRDADEGKFIHKDGVYAW